ncbi:MAG: zinc-binding dehydrogenase, partial [bacterium]|nr:zinc-binding dehydrogenase [bacterium]
MRSALLYGKMDLRVEDVPTPAPGPGELLVKVDIALTCGSDLKSLIRGTHPVLASKLPIPFGHEFTGTVKQLGEGVVEDYQEGDVVMCANSAPCDECFYCKNGQYSLCTGLLFLYGAYSEYVTIPERIVERNTYIKPPNLPSEVAALLEPLSCVIHGYQESNVEKGDTVVVFGCGPIGEMFIILMKRRGATVIAVDPAEDRLKRALDFGADVVLESNDGIVEKVRAESRSGDGADIVIEAVGLSEVWSRALSVVRPGGRAIMFGGCPSGSTLTIETARIHYQEISIIGVFHHTPFSV